MAHLTTKDRFKSAIQQAPTFNTAVNLVTAIHNANVGELLDTLEGLSTSGIAITQQDIANLRKEYIQ
jgi:ketopantoate reductase